jgi:glucosylceramidase
MNAQAELPPPARIELIETARQSSNRLSPVQAPTFAPDPGGPGPVLRPDPSQTYQTLVGFGGAITESSAYNLTRIPPEKAREILESYYHPSKGIGYTLTRTHLNSCDFSLGNWSCLETPGDTTLESFSMEHPRKYIVPALLQAQEIHGSKLPILISPWSPPAWMKTNGEMNNGGSLKPEYRDAWAACYPRFINELTKLGLETWGLTIQNEPAAVQKWDSCIYSPEEERDFVRDHLGPALEKADLQRVKVLVWDHNKDILYERVAPILKDLAAARYVWGIGTHWYGGEQPEQLDRVTSEFPDKPILFTEGCWEGGVKLGQWDRGSRYAHHIITDLNHGTVGWVDWNIVLDEQGGPNHVGNLCDAPVIVDTRTGRVHYQSSFFYIAHFSRYLLPGARRIALSNIDSALESTAFLNPDRSIALVVHNPTPAAIPFRLAWGHSSASCTSPADSIQTYLLHP